MLQVMFKESHPSLNELFEALIFDKIDDDGESRLWYLRLWQAIEEAKGLLGYPQLWNSDIVIAGQKTPRELNEYRNNIAHWYTGRMEFQFFADLQRTAMELLRRKYRNS